MDATLFRSELPRLPGAPEIRRRAAQSGARKQNSEVSRPRSFESLDFPQVLPSFGRRFLRDTKRETREGQAVKTISSTSWLAKMYHNKAMLHVNVWPVAVQLQTAKVAGSGDRRA